MPCHPSTPSPAAGRPNVCGTDPVRGARLTLARGQRRCLLSACGVHELLRAAVAGIGGELELAGDALDEAGEVLDAPVDFVQALHDTDE